MGKILVGVYGTLKQGNRNYDNYLAPHIPIATGNYSVNYQMFTNGMYPMLIESSDPNTIFFEIYEVNKVTFDRMTGLEEPYGYRIDQIILPDMEDKINIYVYDNKNPPTNFYQVKTGNFVATVDWRDLEK